MNRIYKILLITLGAVFLTLFVYCVSIFKELDDLFSGIHYSKEDLVDNYENKRAEIDELSSFVKMMVPESLKVTIEIKEESIAIFHVHSNGNYDSNWDLDRDSKKVDSLLSALGWTNNELEILENKLAEANCISVENGNPTRIGWQRSGMGLFYYNIFNDNLTDSLISKNNDSCTHIFYKDNIVLEYGGGAIGPYCFPGIKAEK